MAVRKDLLADVVADHPEGIKSFSPVLADAIGLRRVLVENRFNPVRVE